MRRIEIRKLPVRITLLFSVLTAVLFLIIYVILFGYFRSFYTRDIRENMKKKLVIVRTFLQDNSLSFAKGRDFNVIGNIGTNLNERLTVIDRNGAVLADSEVPYRELASLENHSNRAEVVDAFRDGFGENSHYSHTLRKEMLYQAVLVSNRSVPYVVRIAAPVSGMKVFSADFSRFFLSILAAIFALGVLMSYFIAKRVSRPLDQMVKWAQKIASGDHSEKIIPRSDDEIGKLANALNDMSVEIREKMDEISGSHARIVRMVQSLIDGIMVIGPDDRVLLINDALKESLTLDGTILGKKYYEVIRIRGIIELIESTVRPGSGGIRHGEITVADARGERVFDLYGIPIFKNNRLDWSVFVFRDMTDILKLEKTRRDFVANVSHELKTPVSIIKGYSETLLDGALDDRENARNFLQLIHDDADRLSRLVDDLLRLSAIESGQLLPDLKPCSAADIVAGTLSRFRQIADAKSIEITNNVPSRLPEILADENMVEEVLINLVDNALKYTHDNGKVTVAAEESGDYLKISVSDNGIGIQKDKINRLVERFYRVDPGRSIKLGGTGLGLSIVKHIVQVHGGEVGVESRLGEGSVFFFTLLIAK